jgi:general secretion pathway protein H
MISPCEIVRRRAMTPALGAAGKAGFTFIEMLVVLGVLALVAGLALPLLVAPRQRAEFRHVAREVAAALREARALAQQRGRTAEFSLDAASGRYRIDGVPPVERRLPAGIRPILLAPADTGGIRFFAEGGSTGGGVRLVQGDRQQDVVVDWLTGRIAIDGGAVSAPH